MSENDLKKFRRQLILTLAVPLTLTLVTVIWSMVSNHFAIKEMQKHKIGREEVYQLNARLIVMIEAKNAKWDMYIISNDEDKLHLREDIKELENDIEDLVRQFSKSRGEGQEVDIYSGKL